MPTLRCVRSALLPLAVLFAGACGGGDGGTGVVPDPLVVAPVALTVVGHANIPAPRRTAELAVRGTTAYSTTWGNSSTIGSTFYIWDVAGSVPVMLDSVKVDNATTLGDIAISDDGSLLVVATERAPGSIVLYDISDPRRPVLRSRFTNSETSPGVHTAEIGRVNGTLYGFLSIDPASGVAARIVIVDLSNPLAVRQVYSQVIGTPYVHDTFLRDGILFLALWNDGVALWDVGGGGKGGTPSSPRPISQLATAGGEVHNIWWMKDPVTGSARYAFIGEEGAGSLGVSSSGDIHVVDIANMAQPREVAFYTVSGAGTHNFSVDEGNGYLYAAYYNGGVRALDVRGDLGTCSDAQKGQPASTGVTLCDLRKMNRERGVGLLDQGSGVYVWGVQVLNGAVYASDMLNGLWKLRTLTRP